MQCVYHWVVPLTQEFQFTPFEPSCGRPVDHCACERGEKSKERASERAKGHRENGREDESIAGWSSVLYLAGQQDALLTVFENKNYYSKLRAKRQKNFDK